MEETLLSLGSSEGTAPGTTPGSGRVPAMEETLLSPGLGEGIAPGITSGASGKALVNSPVATDTTAGGSIAESPTSPACSVIHTPGLTSATSTPRLPAATKRSPRGPCSKSLLNLSSFPASPAYSFRPALRLGPAATGRKSRTEIHAGGPHEANQVTPGPGPSSYEARTCMGRGPRAVLPPRCSSPSRIAKAAEGPGPGAYEARCCIDVGKGPTFTVAPTNRTASHQKVVPGPGEYDPPSSTLRVSGISKWNVPSTQRRVQVRCSEDVLAPGGHSATLMFGEGPKFSFGRSLREQPRSGMLGPGTYGGLYTTFRTPSPTNCRSATGSAPAVG